MINTRAPDGANKYDENANYKYNDWKRKCCQEVLSNSVFVNILISMKGR